MGHLTECLSKLFPWGWSQAQCGKNPRSRVYLLWHWRGGARPLNLMRLKLGWNSAFTATHMHIWSIQWCIYVHTQTEKHALLTFTDIHTQSCIPKRLITDTGSIQSCFNTEFNTDRYPDRSKHAHLLVTLTHLYSPLINSLINEHFPQNVHQRHVCQC